jgi:HK97 family phage major capsid protein
MSMSAPEARAELKTLYTKADEIEKKYPDGLTEAAGGEDFREVKRLLGEIDGLEAKLEALDEAERNRVRITQGKELYSKPLRPDLGAQGKEQEAAVRRLITPGDAFIAGEEYLAAKQRGLFNSERNRVEVAVPLADGSSLVVWSKAAVGRLGPQAKALVYSGTGVGGALVANDVRPGVVGILQRSLVVTDLIPHVQTTSDTIEYITESVWTNNAAPVAEATATTGTSGTKPESVLQFLPATAPVRTVAHWVPATNRMLADAPLVRGYINTRLLGGLDQKLEDQVLNGDGTGENLLGILNTSGIQTTASGSSVVDAIWTARTLVRTNGLAEPNAVVVNPTNFSAIRLARENTASATLGGYLMGPPTTVGPMSIWGLTIYESLYMPAGTVLVGDFSSASTLYDREQGQVRTGFINDQFTRNIVTILAELRAAFVTYRPTAYCRVTGAP